jgi:hypothetical protein
MAGASEDSNPMTRFVVHGWCGFNMRKGNWQIPSKLNEHKSIISDSDAATEIMKDASKYRRLTRV